MLDAALASAWTGHERLSVAGVTGARSDLPPDLTEFVTRVRGATDKPLSVGFGISTPEQVGRVGKIADGVVVGSAVMKAIDEASAWWWSSEEFGRRWCRRRGVGLLRARGGAAPPPSPPRTSLPSPSPRMKQCCV